MRGMLRGGDRRSIGRADEVAAQVIGDPAQFPALLACFDDPDALIRMRAADAAEKVSRAIPGVLQRYKGALLDYLREAQQQELRWHLALMIPRLRMTSSERREVAECLEIYLGDRSSIVKTCAMQALAELADADLQLRAGIVETLRALTRTGTPAMRARGKKLLRKWNSAEG